jgi:RNA polymerase sigma factor (sigma-70 family)
MTPHPAEGETTRLVRQMRDGDPGARARLIEHVCERLRRRTSQMLGDFPALRRWEETADVFQNASLRLHQALENVVVESAAHFFRLAALQIRRELLDLSRHYFGPRGPGANLCAESDRTLRQRPSPEVGEDPQTMAEWTEFHDLAHNLPESEREVFDLLWYGGLTANDAAEALGVDERTVRRRWLSACRMVSRGMNGQMPGGDPS